MKRKIKSAVVGVGYLGKFHADKYAISERAELVAVCDSDALFRKEIATKHGILELSDYKELIGKVDAVSIAVPTALHHKIAKFFLEHDVHVLLEKPICSTLQEAIDLVEIAKKKKLVFQVGHLERFNPVFSAVKPLITKPVFIETHRLTPFKARGTDISVVLDLMIHDIDLVKNLVNSPHKKIMARGLSMLSGKIDVATATIEFENGCIANLNVSRVNPCVERRMRIFQHDSFFDCDFGNMTLKSYHKVRNEIPPYFSGMAEDCVSLDPKDALYEEVDSFLESISHNAKVRVTGDEAKDALKIAVEVAGMIDSQQ